MQALLAPTLLLAANNVALEPAVVPRTSEAKNGRQTLHLRTEAQAHCSAMICVSV
jgi:hypothetical protein